jgi:hypothetical protein
MRTILPGIDLGNKQDGQQRLEQLEHLAAQAGFYWNGRPSVGRWIKHQGERKMLSRKDVATITWREWAANDNENVKWLKVKTDLTGSVEFKVAGVYGRDLTTPHDDKFLLNNAYVLGDLHTLPVMSDLLANINDGINVQLGTVNDGLIDQCGKLIFARIVNMTGDEYIPPDDMMNVSWQAARIFARSGKKQAAQFLKDSGLFKDVFGFRVGGPALSDDCVVEIEHESRPIA